MPPVSIHQTPASLPQNHERNKWASSLSSLKAIAHWVRNFRMCFSVFSYSPSFPIKMHAKDAKTQKIEPDPNFFWRTKVSEVVCKPDWHNVRSYLFFNVRKFRTQCAETLTLHLPTLHIFISQLFLKRHDAATVCSETETFSSNLTWIQLIPKTSSSLHLAAHRPLDSYERLDLHHIFHQVIFLIL